MAIFEQFPPSSWTVGGRPPVVFIATEVVEDGGNRLVERERPYRDGAKLDDTGSKARRWRVTAIFENSVTEGMPMVPYPEALNELVRSFDLHECGDLVLPTTGKVRARAASYTRTEKNDERDGAQVVLNFVEDNEDSVGARAFEPPTVKATVRTLASQTTFSAESDAVFDPTLSDLNEFADGLEAIANFPGDTVQDVDAQAGIVVAATDRVGRAFTTERPTEKARRQLTDPDSSVTQRKLLGLKDTAARAKKDLQPSGIARIVAQDATDLFAIAAAFGHNAEDVIRLNPGLDPLAIQPGDIVAVPGA